MNDRLSYKEKKELPDSVFGLPERREYRLARAILERAKEFGVDVESPAVKDYASR